MIRADPAGASADEPIFSRCGPDGGSIKCRVCSAVDEVVVTELPASMAAYGENTTARCLRCGSSETTDPVYGWRAKPSTPPAPDRAPRESATQSSPACEGACP